MPAYLPLALRLDGRCCVVVGGGAVAERRVEALLAAGAVVRVVAPRLSPGLQAAAEARRLQHIAALFAPAHLDGAALAIAATDVPRVNAAVAEAAETRGVLCNDAGQPERGDVIIPSTVRRGDLLLSVTTCGVSPSLAARIGRDLARQYGPEYAGYAEILGEARAAALERIPDPTRRRRVLEEVAADTALLDLVREGRAQEARERALTCISSSSD